MFLRISSACGEGRVPVKVSATLVVMASLLLLDMRLIQHACCDQCEVSA